MQDYWKYLDSYFFLRNLIMLIVSICCFKSIKKRIQLKFLFPKFWSKLLDSFLGKDKRNKEVKCQVIEMRALASRKKNRAFQSIKRNDQKKETSVTVPCFVQIWKNVKSFFLLLSKELSPKAGQLRCWWGGQLKLIFELI